jgi:galactose mutarotase-like enzyme
MLRKLEDGILILCEGELYTLALARASLSTWLETKFTEIQVKQAALRLSRLKLVKWHYYGKGKYKVSYRLKTGSCRVTLKATVKGEEYLSQARAAA